METGKLLVAHVKPGGICGEAWQCCIWNLVLHRLHLQGKGIKLLLTDLEANGKLRGAAEERSVVCGMVAQRHKQECQV